MGVEFFDYETVLGFRIHIELALYDGGWGSENLNWSSFGNNRREGIVEEYLGFADDELRGAGKLNLSPGRINAVCR